MRIAFRHASLGLALVLAGCVLDGVPPADGIYTGTLTTATGADNIYTVIDSSGTGVIIDTSNPGITRFTISSIDDKGNFTAPTTSFAGSAVSVAGGTAATSGSISGTLNGKTSDNISSTTSRSTITGNLLTSLGASQPFTLTYQPSAYEDNVTSLSTIVTPTSSSATAALSYSYTPAGSTTLTTVSLTLSSVQQTTSTNPSYPFTGTDSLGCTYSGVISMPDSSYNAFDLGMTVSCNGNSSSRTGLAYVNGTSPTTLTMEYNDSSSFAVAANATLTN
jgi:hypothetical protein